MGAVVKALRPGIVLLLLVFVVASYIYADSGSAIHKPWQVKTMFRVGYTTYKEKVAPIKTDYDSVYLEGKVSAVYEAKNGLQALFDLSGGGSIENGEDVKVAGIDYQTDDMYFYRASPRVGLGWVFYLDESKNTSIAPFGAYTFRFTDFRRKNFVVLGTPLSGSASEKVYLHCGGGGLKFNAKLNEKFSLDISGACAYIFSSQADNSVAGITIDGDGGFVAEGDVNLEYALSDSCKLIFGGFADVQNVDGGSSGGWIWPDNKLHTFGGNIGLKYSF